MLQGPAKLLSSVPMRVALISDLHANEVALTSVLEDIERVGADRIVCLGDVATLGPHPGEVVDRLRDLGCMCILGNHDDFLLQPELIRRYTESPLVVDAVDWCRDALVPEQLEFLETFVAGAEIDLDGGAKLGLFHGSPRSHMEDMLSTTPPERVDEMLGGFAATVLAGGHTHVQMLRQHRGALLVNPGSLGLPFREYVDGGVPTVLPHAEYAIVEAQKGRVNVELRRVHPPQDSLRSAAAGWGHPMSEFLAQQYR